MCVCRFEQTGYTVKRIEPSLDKSCLLVYISTVDSTVTASAAASEAGSAGALLIYQVMSSQLSIYYKRCSIVSIQYQEVGFAWCSSVKWSNYPPMQKALSKISKLIPIRYFQYWMCLLVCNVSRF